MSPPSAREASYAPRDENAHYIFPQKSGTNAGAPVQDVKNGFHAAPAMRGVPARAVQELRRPSRSRSRDDGRYMHLSPAALDAAIRLLETPVESDTQTRGGIVEAQGTRG
jgi:hypothetical protein